MGLGSEPTTPTTLTRSAVDSFPHFSPDRPIGASRRAAGARTPSPDHAQTSRSLSRRPVSHTKRPLCWARDGVAVTAPIRHGRMGIALSNRQATGRVRIQLFGKSYAATWRIVEGSVEVTSTLGVGSVALGALASAPSIAATEKLREMALQANRSVQPKSDRARFNVRDA
jgi:hypothetical protein